MLKILDLRFNFRIKTQIIFLLLSLSSRNQLAYIPPALCKLPNLEVLIIHNNKLVSLPEEIGQLDRLIELVCLTYKFIFLLFYFSKQKDVSSNDLTQLPYQIGLLSSLRTLNIRRNMIVELPTGK